MRRILLISFTIILCIHEALGQECSVPKLYLHTDKTQYFSGETVFFKAYLLNQFVPDESATVLIVTITDTNNAILKNKSFPVINGYAIGSILLEDHFKSGYYFISAFIKPSDTSKNIFPSFLKTFLIRSRDFQEISPNNSMIGTVANLDIYPDLTLDNCNLNFGFLCKTTSLLGIPINVNGVVFNDLGDTVHRFTSTSLGIGKITFQKENLRKYFVMAIGPMGDSIIRKLPEFDHDRFYFASKNTSNGLEVCVWKSAKLNTDSVQVYTVKGFVENTEVFKKSIKDLQIPFKFNIPLVDLPACTFRLVVEGESSQILGEKYIFVNGDLASAVMNISVDSVSHIVNGQSAFTLKWADSLRGNVSISITNPNQAIPLFQDDIYASLLLPFGWTKNAFIVQKNDSISIQDRMELLLAKFADNPVIRQGLPCFSSDTGYISFKGLVLDKVSGKPIRSADGKLIFSDNDSLGVNILPVTTDKNGFFKVSKLIFEGIGTFRFQPEKKTGDIKIIIDSTYGKINPLSLELKTHSHLTQYNPNWPSVMETDKGDIPLKKSEKSDREETLNPVTVRATSGRPIDRVNKKYTRGLFTSTAFARSLDFITDPPTTTGGNILDYLVGRVNGLLIDPNGYKLSSSRWVSYSKTDGSAQPAIRLFLNEQETSVNFLTMIHPGDVALVKYFPPGNAPLPGIGMAGVLAVYTRKYDDYTSSDSKTSATFTIKGFDKSSDFEDNKIKANTSTLYWNPIVSMDGSHQQFHINFRNRFGLEKFLISINGVTQDGRLIHVEKYF